MAEQQAAARPDGNMTDVMARALAARLAGRGYQARFPPGRDPAVFKVTGLYGDPDVEVTAEDDGQTACPYTGRSAAEAAVVIARLPPPGSSRAQAAAAGTVTATWDGIAIEWHWPPPAPGLTTRTRSPHCSRTWPSWLTALTERMAPR